MNWETWPKRMPEIKVVCFDSTKPWNGPGELITAASGELILLQDGDRDIRDLKHGDVLYMNRHGFVFRADDAKLAELKKNWRPPEQSAIPR